LEISIIRTTLGVKSGHSYGIFPKEGRYTKTVLIKWVSKTLQQRLFQIKPRSSEKHSDLAAEIPPLGRSTFSEHFDKASTSCGCKLHKSIPDFHKKWTDPKNGIFRMEGQTWLQVWLQIVNVQHRVPPFAFISKYWPFFRHRALTNYWKSDKVVLSFQFLHFICTVLTADGSLG